MTAAGTETPPHVRAQGLLGLGTLLISTERHLDSVPMLEEAAALYRHLDEEGGDPSLLMYGYSAALINLGAEMEGLGEYDRAGELNEQALEVSRRIGDPAGLAVSIGNLAEYAGRSGDIEGARERFKDAIAASRALQSAQRLVEQYFQVGFFELSAGEPLRAREAFQHALAQAEGGGLENYGPQSRAYLAFCEAEAGDDVALDRYVEHARRSFENPDVRVFGAVRVVNLVLRAVVDARRGDLDHAALCLGAVGAEEEEGNVPWWVLDGLRDQVGEVIAAGLDTDRAAQAQESGRTLDLDGRVDLITAPA